MEKFDDDPLIRVANKKEVKHPITQFIKGTSNPK